MDTPTSPMIWAVAAPLLAAGALVVAGRRGRRVIVVAALAALALASAGLVRRVAGAGPWRYDIGGWDAPLGIGLHADGLSVFMVALTAGVNLLVSLYAAGYLPRQHESESDVTGSFWPLFFFLWLAMNGIYLAADLFHIYVALEVLGIAAVALVALGGGPALVAGTRYVLVTLLGSLLYLLGVALLYAGHGVVDMAMVGQQVVPGAIAWAALAAMTLGMALKTALVPLHFWLPPAHANALSPVSALLSALVVKASFYVVLRLWITVFPGVVPLAFSEVLGVLGVLAIVWGSVQAMRQRSIKMLVAYSTVAQIGYVFLAFPLGMRGSEGAWQGALTFAAAHACAKAAMFLAAGTIKHVLGHDDRAVMRGLGVRMPLTVFSLGLAGITLIGLPPTGAFVAKWMLLIAAIELGRWVLAVVIVAGSLLAAGYIVPLLADALRTPDEPAPVERVPASMQLATLGLALAGFFLGFLSRAPMDFVRVGDPFAAVGGWP